MAGLALPLVGLAGTAVAANPGCAKQPPDGIAVFLPWPGPMQITDAQAVRPIGDANAIFGRMGAREYLSGDCAVQEQVVPLDGSADRAGDHRASELGAVFVFR